MNTIIIGVILLASVLLILVILAQNSKGGGLSSQFGGSGASNMIGVKKTTDLLEKVTWGLALVIVVLSLGSNINLAEKAADDFSDRVQPNSAPAIDLPVQDESLEQLRPADPTTDSTGN